jgi:hypothetical protein
MNCILRSKSCLSDTQTPSDPYPTPSLPKGSLYPSAVETQFSTGWYWPILQLMTTGLHSTTSPSCVERFHISCASSCFIALLRVSLHIFAFHRDLVCIITGASIHCPASSLAHRILFITISDYVWHCTIIISLWTLTLPHLHT